MLNFKVQKCVTLKRWMAECESISIFRYRTL